MLASEITAEEFGKLFLRFKDKYISIARSYTRDYAAAQDIVTECFASFWDSRSNIELVSSPEAYILRSVKNRSLNHLRRMDVKMRASEVQEADLLRIMELDMAFLSEDNIDFLFGSEVAGIISKFMASLSPRTRDIFWSSRWGGLTYKEISDKFGVSERIVKRDISKVLAALRVALADYLPVYFFLFLSGMGGLR